MCEIDCESCIEFRRSDLFAGEIMCWSGHVHPGDGCDYKYKVDADKCPDFSVCEADKGLLKVSEKKDSNMDIEFVKEPKYYYDQANRTTILAGAKFTDAERLERLRASGGRYE